MTRVAFGRPAQGGEPNYQTKVFDVEIDTVLGLLRLPPGKLTLMRCMLPDWSKRRVVRIGSCCHSPPCRRINEIRSHLITAFARSVQSFHHFVRLNSEARSGIQLWKAFTSHYNGVGLLSTLGQSDSSVWIRSTRPQVGDAMPSGGAWLQLQWAGELLGWG